MNRQQSGFTLVELVAVIVLLGILAVTALPRFIDLQGNARTGVINGLRAAMEGAAAQIYAKSLLAGVEGATNDAGSTVASNGETVEVRAGYPKAIQDTATNWDILDLIQFDTAVFTTQDQDGSDRVNIGYNLNQDATVTDDDCYVYYIETDDPNEPPDIQSVVGGC